MTAPNIGAWKRRLGNPGIQFVDSTIYTDPDIFELELDKIWRHTWLLALHESELPNAYDYRTLSVAREPVVIIRGEDMRVRAFLNVCPHRGALLLREPADLIDELSSASRNGTFREALARFVKPAVLVVDEVGYLACSNDAANVLFHVVGERHTRKRSMVFTTNKNPKRWGAVLHDDDLADAIVDRILERGRRLKLDGPSVRTNHLPELTDDDDDVTPESSRIFSGTQAASFPEPTVARYSRTPAGKVSIAQRPPARGAASEPICRTERERCGHCVLPLR